MSSNVVCENNTFYGNKSNESASAIGVYNFAVLDMRNCIIASSSGPAAVYCWEGGTATLDCNDYWANDSDFEACAPGPHDFFLDPLLCDPENNEFRLDCQSPCVNWPGCGLVGALGVGCEPTEAEPTTWGSIKALYSR
jgi:hypothetical protein